jgi:hypothetical protein
MRQLQNRSRRAEPSRVLMPAAEVQYFCRACKVHDSRTLREGQWRELRCRCGSTDLLIYRVSDDLALAN